jgi:hypothetical protein
MGCAACRSALVCSGLLEPHFGPLRCFSVRCRAKCLIVSQLITAALSRRRHCSRSDVQKPDSCTVSRIERECPASHGLPNFKVIDLQHISTRLRPRDNGNAHDVGSIDVVEVRPTKRERLPVGSSGERSHR